MNKRSWLMKLIAFTIVFAMMLSPVGIFRNRAGYVTTAALAEGEEVTEQVTEPEPEPESEEEPEPEPEPAPEPEPEPEPAPEPEPEPEPEPAPVPEPEPEPEPEPAPEPEPEPEPEPAPEPEPEKEVVTELEPQPESRIEEIEEEDDDDWEEDADDDFDDDDEFVEFDDDEVAEISADLLEQFNNPDSFEQMEFSGSADISLKTANWDENWDGQVTLIAKVQDTNLSYRLVWEANDGDSRGWFTIGSGSEYSYTLTKDNLAREANREYRVVMFTVD